jgi:hypothetical protein
MRNKLAGTKTGTSKTAKYYHDNPEARKKKLAYDSKYEDTPARQKYRAELQKINRKNGTHGNGDNMDVSHLSKTKTRMQAQSKNRADKKRSFFKS